MPTPRKTTPPRMNMSPTYQVDKPESTVAKLKRELAEKTAELETFKLEVRREVLDAKKRYSLCDDGVSRFLENLDIPGEEREFVGVVTVRVSVRFTAEDNGSTEYAQTFLDDFNACDLVAIVKPHVSNHPNIINIEVMNDEFEVESIEIV